MLAGISAPLAWPDVAIVGGTLYTMETDAPTRGATLLIAQGVVEAVAPDLDVPAGYERIDATGKYITPGLIEAYSQLGLEEIGGEPKTNDDTVSNFKLGPAFDVRYAINPASTLLPVNRMDGVTRAVIAPTPGNDPLAGWGAAIHLGTTPAGAVPAVGESIITHTRIALFGSAGVGATAFVGGSRSALLQRLRQAFTDARRFTPGRYQPGRDEYGIQDMRALREFLGADVPLVLAVNRANEILELLTITRELKIDLVILGGAEAWQVAGRLAEADVPVIVDVLANLPRSYDELGARLDNVAMLYSAGVRVMITAENTHNARLLRQSAGNAVAEGLPWGAALRAITREPARVFQLGDAVGTLMPGAPADLVIWNGDPLEVTSWAERVMINGEWMPMRSRQSRLYERYKNLDDEIPVGFR
ncbi:MAG: amidohydrolase family protein [Gammaproteobacteria bacterium]|nr:amidohydrolase family protein [Gammaproteobacteria bacterium]